MAFEDRCSPQSAPSPPGVPHSPHNTAMICSDITSTSSLSTSPEMALDVCNDDRVSPMHVKQEDDTTVNHPETPIRFSITNILSNNFGKVNRKTGGERKTSLFRPYDTEPNAMQSSIPQKPTEDLIENNVQCTVQSKLNGVLDYSNRAHSFFYNNNNLEHAKFLQYYSHHHNQFNLAAASTLYPRLHEDILNSKKYHQQYYQPAPVLSDSAISKIPPLGNLCKTVSQIGQPTASKSPVSNLVKRSNHNINDTEDQTERQQQQLQQQQQQKSQQANNLDSGLESSDDTKSETGSTKDENASQLWPAWIYCTRYSDRPSSGKYPQS